PWTRVALSLLRTTCRTPSGAWCRPPPSRSRKAGQSWPAFQALALDACHSGVFFVFRPVVLVAVDAAAKDSGADTYFRRAFLDGDFEVAAHAHGKPGQFDAVYGFIHHAIAQLPQVAEAGAHGILVSG